MDISVLFMQSGPVDLERVVDMFDSGWGIVLFVIIVVFAFIFSGAPLFISLFVSQLRGTSCPADPDVDDNEETGQ